MDIKNILNKTEWLKSYVYRNVTWNTTETELLVNVEPRKGSKPVCSICGTKGPVYDHLKARRFQYIPLWGIAVYFIYAMRRVNCPHCGVKVESIPWAIGKKRLTRSFSLFLSRWARKLSWKETATTFGTSWNRVYDAVKWVVDYGMQHRDLQGVTAIGVDEIQFGKGQKYLTLVYQIDAGLKRLLYIGNKREARTLLRFFHDMGTDWCNGIQFVCTDMWQPYLKVIKKKLSNALNILDRFHIVKKLNERVNDVRIEEVKRMRAEGYEEILKNTKYCFLKNPENMTDKQEVRLKDVLQYDLKSVRAYQLRESFQLFWTYTSPYWAEWYLKKWCTRAMRSKLEPIKKFVRTIRNHEDLILNWFRAKKEFSSGVVEGINRKVNLVTRKSYGFRTQKVLEIALFHTLGKLPEPDSTHRFW